MANLQVKNLPEALHRKLRRFARQDGRPLRDLVLGALLREIADREFRERLKTREPVELPRGAGRSLDEARAEREREL